MVSGGLVEAGGLDAAADLGEVEGVVGEAGPGVPAVEGVVDGGLGDVGAGDGQDVVGVVSVGVGDDGEELAGGVFGGAAEAELAGRPSVASTKCQRSA